MNKKVLATVMAACTLAGAQTHLSAESPSTFAKFKTYAADFVKKNKSAIIETSVGVGLGLVCAGTFYIYKNLVDGIQDIEMDFKSVKGDRTIINFRKDFIKNLRTFERSLVVNNITLAEICDVFAATSSDEIPSDLRKELKSFLFPKKINKNISITEKGKLTITRTLEKDKSKNIEIKFEKYYNKPKIIKKENNKLENNQENKITTTAKPDSEKCTSKTEMRKLLKEAIILKMNPDKKSSNINEQEMNNKIDTAIENLKNEIVEEFVAWGMSIKPDDSGIDAQKLALSKMLSKDVNEKIQKNIEAVKERIHTILNSFDEIRSSVEDNKLQLKSGESFDKITDYILGEMVDCLYDIVNNVDNAQ